MCAGLPRIHLATPVIVVQHVREQPKPTSTVRLLASMLDNLRVLPYGMREPAFDPSPLEQHDVQRLLLSPRDDATELAAPEPGARPRGFVVLDGTWSQCSRMARRVPVVRELPCVALPAGPKSIWGLRTQPHEYGMSTLEATLRALATVEGSAVLQPLHDAFAEVTARMMALRGKPPVSEVADAEPR
jgi:DTW domain-containing protein YfiP